jgi:glutaredoxin
MFSRWLQYLGFGSQRRPDLHFVLYTRKGCHLCEDVWHLLEQAQKQRDFRLDCVDIDHDADLLAAHGDWVPVVAVNGVVRFRGRVNVVLLQRLLDAAPQGEKENPGS